MLCRYSHPANGAVGFGGLRGFPIADKSGDLRCMSEIDVVRTGTTNANAAPMYGIPLLSHADLVQSFAALGDPSLQPQLVMGGDDLLAACIADLQTSPPPFDSVLLPIPPTFTDPFGNIIVKPLAIQNFNYGPGKYFDSTHRCAALGYVMEAIWTLRPDKNPTTQSYFRIYMRVLQQWLEMHSFVARQGIQTNELDQILSSATSSAGGATDPAVSVPHPSKAQIVDLVTKGLALILNETTDPVAGNHLNFIDQDHLANPDYRLDAEGSPPGQPPTLAEHPEYEQRAGLPTTMIETGAAYLDAVTALLSESSIATYETARGGAFSSARDQAMRTGGDAIRLMAALYQTGIDLHDRACGMTPSTGTCAIALEWEGRWQQALQEFAAARSRTLGQLASMTSVTNPLGIAENDLPLFFGDPVGDTSRFFASSDYLINTWAAPAVASAQTALATARQAWIDQRNSTIQDQLLQADQQRRLEQLGEKYGGVIVDNCGITQINGQSVEGKDVFPLVANGVISLANCFLDSTPACVPQVSPGAAGPPPPTPPMVPNSSVWRGTPPGATIDLQQVRSTLCVWSQVSNRLSIPSDALNCVPKGGNDGAPQNWRNATFESGVIHCVEDQLGASILFRDVGLLDVSPQELDAAEDYCSQQLVFEKLPVVDVSAECLHGKMGEAFSQLQSAKQEVNAASASIAAKQVAWQNQADLCVAAAGDEQDRQEAQQVVNLLKDHFSGIRALARETSRTIEGFQGGFEAIAGASTDNPSEFGNGLFHILDSASGNSTAGPSASDAEARVEASYQDLLQNQSRAESLRSCFMQQNNLKAEIDAAAQVVQSRKANVTSAAVNLANLVGQNQQQYAEGAAALAREANRPVGGYAHHYWLDEKISRFRTEFEWSRRLTFLAMRAVEYEFQQSLPLRTQILTATHPDQLEQAVLALQQEQASRSINRRRPEEQSLVLSLRDDVLRVPDATNAAAGERAWTPAQKFEGRLSHPQYTIRDDDGNWLGQGVLFTLDPLAGGAQSGISLVNRCGERLWRVTATIQGDGLSTSQPGTPVFLMKRNTFESQWCRGLGDGSALQTASIQPSHQLFRPTDVAAPIDDARGFTGAAIYPWFNIRRSDFYKISYQDGSSEELAGRALYGDYILLFPKELIESGFPLDRVEDILLRLDYLSVDNLPDPSL